MQQFYDSVELGDARVSSSGYLVAHARFARTGIQVYGGRELGKPEMASVRVYRPEDEVFSSDSMASFAHKPVTNDHPPQMVDAKNWSRFAKGHTGDEVVRDGSFVRIPMMVSDGSLVDAINKGKRQLSAGYTADIDWSPGTTPEGEPFDAVQRNIRANHLAVVQLGRAGIECRVGDALPPSEPEPEIKEIIRMATITLDGASVEIPDAAVAAVTKLQADLAAATTTVSARDGALDALRTTHATELAAANARVLDAAAIDAAIAERTALIDSAKPLLAKDFAFTGKSNADIRRAAVVAKLGDAKLTGKDDSYVQAAFDTLSATAIEVKADPIVDALKTPVGDAVKTKTAYETFVDELLTAHLPNKG